MKERKGLLGLVMLMLCAVLCSGCGKDAKNLEQYFSQEEIDSWKQEGKDRKYTMNGGYLISFGGQLYPVNFEDGKIYWQTTPPEDLLFVKMYELYTDAGLKKRCAYLGKYDESRLFQEDIQHTGFILDGRRPGYGTVLYLDETNLRHFALEYGDNACFGPDEEIVPLWKGKPREAVFVHGKILLTDEKGVFFEERNTFRKLCGYARETGIHFDAYTEYTNLPYPGSLLTVIDDLWWEDTDPGPDGIFSLQAVTYPDCYHVTLSYQNEAMPDLNCMVFTNMGAIEHFYWEIGLQNDYNYKNVVCDQQGKVVQCYAKKFFGKDKGAEVTAFFYSQQEFNDFLQDTFYLDADTGKALCGFSVTENGDVFDGALDYPLGGGDYALLTLYGVWDSYRMVNLHTPDAATEVLVCKNKDAVLPYAMYPGHVFEGWYADAEFSGQPITRVTHTDGYTDLYARFREVDHYTLTFEPYEGKNTESIQYVYGEEFALPIITKAFHIFKGWCTDPDGHGEPIKHISADFYGSFHLYPCFEPMEYTVTVHFRDKTVDLSARYGQHYTLYAEGMGEDFLGYFDKDGVQYTDEQGNSLVPFTDGADIQLYAKYKEE